MNDQPDQLSDQASNSSENLLESLLFRFDQEWHEGNPPSISDWLEQGPRSMRQELLCELIKIDLEYRWKRGEHRLIEEYLGEFPELGASGEVPVELIAEEIHCRQRFETNPAFSEIQKRFPERASQFRELLESPSSPAFRSGQRSKHRKSLSTLVNESANQTLADASSSRSGNVLAGRFELKDRLGQGAFATVYRAWDRVLQRPVAVKIARAALVTDPAMGQRFLREAQSAARLEHPGIVSVYEVGEQDDQFFMVQELIQGGTLAEQLDDMAGDPERVATLVSEICTAMDYAHRCGIVHRDLKPANIMLDREGHPRIADFGLAAQTDSSLTLTQEGDLLGTPAYMSPEQARGDHRHVGAASDIYSAGVVLYQLLCQQLPFTGDPVGVINQVVHNEPVAPRKIRKTVSIDLQTICLKAMEKDPARRYRSAGAMAEDLHRFLNNEPIMARPTGPLEQLWKWCRRRPALAATIAASLMALIVLSIISYIGISNERDRFREQRDLAQQEFQRANDEAIRANAALFSALTNNVENEIRNRSHGWHDRAVSTIRKASALEIPDRDTSRLRELAIELLTDNSFRLEETGTWQPHRSGLIVTSIVQNADEDLMAICYNDGVVRLLGTGDQTVDCRLTGPRMKVSCLTIDDEDRWIIGLSEEQIWLWTLPESISGLDPPTLTGTILTHEPCTAIALSPDQTLLGVGYESGDIVTFDFEDGEIGAIRNELFQHEYEVHHIAISPDNLLLGSTARDGFVIQWDLSRDSIVGSHNNVDPVSCLRFGNVETRMLFSDTTSFSFVTWSPGGTPTTVRGPGVVRQASFMPNGHVATASLDGALRIWAGSTVTSEITGLGELFSICVSSDGQQILVGNRGGLVREFRIQRGRIAQNFTASHRCVIGDQNRLHTETRSESLAVGDEEGSDAIPYENLAITAMVEDYVNDTIIAGTRTGTLVLHQVESGDYQIKRSVHQQPIVALALALDGSWFASIGQQGRVLLHDAESQETILEFDFDVGRVLSVSASPDGQWLAAGGSRGYQIADISSDEPELRHVIQQYQAHASVVFGEDCLLVGRPDGAIDVRDVSGRKIIRKLREHSEPVIAMQFAQDFQALYTSSMGNRLIRWSWPVGQALESVSTDAPLRSLATDPQNRMLITTVPGRAEFRDPDSLQSLVQTRYWGVYPGGQLFSQDNESVWVGSAGLIRYSKSKLLDACDAARDSGQTRLLNSVDGKKTVPGGFSNQIWGLALAPDRAWLAAGEHDGNVLIFDSQTGQQLESLSGHRSVVWTVDFNPDASTMVTGGARHPDAEVLVWSTEDWSIQHRIRLGKQLASSVACHPERPWAVVSTYGGSVDLVDLDKGKIIQSILTNHGRIDCSQFSRDGKRMLSVCNKRGVIVWDVEDRDDHLELSELAVFQFAGEQHREARFTRRGDAIAIGSENGTVRLIDIENGELLLKINSGPPRIRQFAFSVDDRFLACSGYTPVGRIWDLQRLRDRLADFGLAHEPDEIGSHDDTSD